MITVIALENYVGIALSITAGEAYSAKEAGMQIQGHEGWMIQFNGTAEFILKRRFRKLGPNPTKLERVIYGV